MRRRRRALEKAAPRIKRYSLMVDQHGSIRGMVDEVDVRQFRPEDASKLTKMLHRAYAELGAAGLNFTAFDQDEETTLRRASGGESWVMTSGNELVAAMTLTFPPEAALRE